MADTTAMLLRLSGYVTLPCYSGKDCLATIPTFRPELVLLDLTMPELDGYETCDEIRQMPDYRELPIIAYSALDTTLFEEEAERCGFSLFLGKPSSIEKIKAAIEQVMAK